MKTSIIIEYHAGNLPETWNNRCNCYFQTKDFLLHAEKHNFSKQRYYYTEKAGEILAGAILYSLRLDLFTFLRIKSPLTMHIVGIPCSVSCPGIFGDWEAVKELKKHILTNEKGFLLFLNLEIIIDETLPSGKTLPTLILKNLFSSVEEYMDSLRSDYRRRTKKLLYLPNGIKIEKRNFSNFTQKMYQQYLDVFRRSNDKLEKLDYDFFRNLEEPFQLMVCIKNEDVIGWNITLQNNNTFYFFLGGIDYQYNKTNSTYLKLMLQIVTEGIERNAHQIDLGQTAEIPKMKLGALPESRYMQAYHSNKIVLFLLKKAERLLSYKRNVPQVHIFKTDAS